MAASAKEIFAYLSKKIAIPREVRIASLGWNADPGWIAVGGANGLLKVLKLDTTNGPGGARGVAAPSNLTMNQTLDGHEGIVRRVVWNPSYRRLTSSDANGLIIVWSLHKASWYEEMINNRNRSVVTDMKWNKSGKKICIVYEDGAVIVGSVEGTREWGRELQMNLAFVAWSPDERNILFVTMEADIKIYDHLGNFQSHLEKFGVQSGSERSNVAGIDWYSGREGYSDIDAPTLAIAFENGVVQLTRSLADREPVLIQTKMRLSQCQWNPNGTVLALAGMMSTRTSKGATRELSAVQFYSPMGKHLRTLRVPASKKAGEGVSALAWEGRGLRIALAVDHFIYFANMRPAYKWGYFASTLVYAYNRPGRDDHCVAFWPTSGEDVTTRWVPRLLGVVAAGDNCVLAYRSPQRADRYVLQLCNAIGAPVDSKTIPVQPKSMAMTTQHIIVASDTMVYVWHYRTAVSKLTSVVSAKSHQRREGRERAFRIDDTSARDILPSFEAGGDDGYGAASAETSDPVCCLCASDKLLIIGRSSGKLYRFTLPHLGRDNDMKVKGRPAVLSINCDSTRLAIVDANGVLRLLDLTVGGNGMGFEEEAPSSSSSSSSRSAARGGGRKAPFTKIERKDVWAVMWAEDNPTMFAIMEKTKMYIFRDTKPEAAVVSSGYLCQFRDLEMKMVLLDEIMGAPQHPTKSLLLEHETHTLRDARDLLVRVGIEDAYEYIAAHPHVRLWKLLADSALSELNFGVADKAFVQCKDYQGVQMVKRLRILTDKQKQRAEVAVHFQKFDEAEKIYREIDRLDLAVELRARIGDWFRVVALLQAGSGSGNDALLKKAYNEIGFYYAHRAKWDKAVEHFKRSKNHEMVAQSLAMVGDFDGLDELVGLLPERHATLHEIAARFEAFGRSQSAVGAYAKAGAIKQAIDACIKLNQWDAAVELAQQHSFPQIEGLLAKYAAHLLQTGGVHGRIQAVELYRRADKSTDAAAILMRMASEVSAQRMHPLRAKKLAVLAALEMDRYRSRVLDTQLLTTTTGAGTKVDAAATTQAQLTSLMTHDAATSQSKSMDDAWHAAEGHHLWLLAQRSLVRGDDLHIAMCAALRLEAYEDVLEPKAIYSLIALCAFYNRHYGQCSRAFIRLENLDGQSHEERAVFSDLAMAIFVSKAPVDPAPRRGANACGKCGQGDLRDWDSACSNCDARFEFCVATAQRVDERQPSWACRVCRHKVLNESKWKCCPLCHSKR